MNRLIKATQLWAIDKGLQLEMAYKKIADRDGEMVNGLFIKEEDLDEI